MSYDLRMIDDSNRKAEIVKFYNSALHESTKPRRTKKRITVAEVRRDTFKKVCQRLLPITLVAGIAIGGLGFSTVNNIKSSWDSNSYLSEQVTDFRKDFINPNTHRTEDNQRYWYDYYEISRGIENAVNQDEAIFYCYLNIGSLQTGRVIDYVGYDTFMGYIQSKGFDTLEDYEDFMKKEVSLRNEIDDEKKELNKMMNEHSITYDYENKSIGGK